VGKCGATEQSTSQYPTSSEQPPIALNTSIIAAMTMESALNEIRGLYANASAAEQQKMQEQLRGLQNELYTDWEVLFSLVMGVGHIKLSLSRSLT
jgi:hypothetical protein